MSNHTKAWAIAREVPDHELRDALVVAHERILDAAEDFDGERSGDSLEETVDEAIAQRDILRGVADKLDCNIDEIEIAVEDLVEKTGAEPDGTPTSQALARTRDRLEEALRRIADLETEREQFCRRIAALESSHVSAAELPEQLRYVVGDVLAMSRRLTSLCEQAGIKPTHLRVTRPRRRMS